MPLAVNQPGPEITPRADDWRRIDALLGGTSAMRAASTFLLPQWPAETNEAYNARLATATLFPALRRTLRVMAGKPFSKPLALQGPNAVLAQWQPWADDIDRLGTSLHVFAAEMLTEGMGYGLAGIYVDYPRAVNVKRAADGTVTREAERAAGLRPYFVRVLHSQLLGWRFGADGRLEMLRFLETAQIPDGDWGSKAVERVRVLRRGSWELHEKLGDTWTMTDQGATPNMPDIPFVPTYGCRVRFMDGAPALMDVAHLNIKHWQSQSDQDTILHAARVPILSVRGVAGEFSLAIGGSTAVNLGDAPDAELKWVEHTGASIEAGRTSLLDLEQQMIQSGAELLVKQPGQRTATESSNDAEGNKCELQRIVEDFEDSLDQALALAGRYAGVPAPTVELFKDFGSASLSEATATLIADLHTRGILSKRTAITEIKRTGVLSDKVDPDEEADRVAEEGPPLGMVPPSADDDAGDDA